jgi:hypothetical protein
MPSPTNSTKNATESGFSVPTSAKPSAAAMASPQTRAIRVARMVRQERSASHRISSTAASVTRPLKTACSCRTLNCESFIGTSPVSRTRA